jgi:virginiamycin B lyase
MGPHDDLTVPESLKTILGRFGVAIIQDPRRLEALLLDYKGDRKREIFLVIGAARSGVVDRLLEMQGTAPSVSKLLGLRTQLEDRMGFTQAAAASSLESWCAALDITVPPVTTRPVQGEVPAEANRPDEIFRQAQPKRVLAGRISAYPVGSYATGQSAGGIVIGPDRALWVGFESHDPALPEASAVCWVSKLHDRRWTPVTRNSLGGIPLSMVVAQDNAVWFVGSGEFAYSVGRLSPEGTVETIPLGSMGRPLDDFGGWNDIVAGSDGRLWIAGGNLSAIAAVGIDRRVALYAMPDGRIQPWQLTEGPDGALWFTQIERNAIGRMSRDGMVNEYPFPSSVENRAAGGIVVGLDRNLWFTEVSADRLWAMSPTGEIITRIELRPEGLEVPWRLVVGPDDALWFTGMLSKNLGRMAADGSRSYLSTDVSGPLEGQSPWSILSDGDRIWFSVGNGQAVGSIE